MFRARNGGKEVSSERADSFPSDSILSASAYRRLERQRVGGERALKGMRMRKAAHGARTMVDPSQTAVHALLKDEVRSLPGRARGRAPIQWYAHRTMSRMPAFPCIWYQRLPPPGVRLDGHVCAVRSCGGPPDKARLLVLG